MKKLYRSTSNKMLGGVCGGIGEYLDVDPTIIRILWILFGLTGFGVLAYILAWIVMPPKKR
jgi:phage shock protein C